VRVHAEAYGAVLPRFDQRRRRFDLEPSGGFNGSGPEQREDTKTMKILVQALGTAGLLALAACGGNADDKAAENITEMTENKADALEAQADNMSGAAEDRLEDQADQVREQGEDAADKADDNDDARIENQVANQINGM
jgi:uncharacterized protein YjbJ (UPF0337 family)